MAMTAAQEVLFGGDRFAALHNSIINKYLIPTNTSSENGVLPIGKPAMIECAGEHHGYVHCSMCIAFLQTMASSGPGARE